MREPTAADIEWVECPICKKKIALTDDMRLVVHNLYWLPPERGISRPVRCRGSGMQMEVRIDVN